MTGPRLSYRARAGVLLLSAAVLLGADCPHCDATRDVGTGSGHAAPSCHEQPSAPEPFDAEQEPALDCGCPSCEVEAGVASLAGAGEGARASGVVVFPVRPAPSLVLATRGDWKAPPYPGFSDNTVVLLT